MTVFSLEALNFLFENPAYIHYKACLFYSVAKTMFERKFCESCHERHECQKVYEQLGKSEGPSVVFKVVLAFLLPLVVFIVSLAAFEWILAGAIEAEGLRTGVSLLLAFSVTAALTLIIRVINRQFRKNR